jgi:hypothetical protein
MQNYNATHNTRIQSVRALCSTPTRTDLPGIDGMEVTQTIQDINHSVPLIAGKVTVIRLYLSPGTADPAVTVRGELAVTKAPGVGAVTIPSLNAVVLDPALIGQLAAKRRDLQRSLNFMIPADQTTPGLLYIRLTRLINAATGAQLNVSLNNLSSTRTVIFTAGAPLRVRVLGVSYQQGTPPAPSVTHTPSTLDFNLVDSWLRRAYPVPEVISTRAIVAATPTPPFTAATINAQVAAIRALDVSGGAIDARTHYYGLVSDRGFFMRGLATIPANPDPTAVSSGPTGTPAGTFAWDTDASFGDWYAGHELAHTFGRKHPGFCADNTSDDPSYPFSAGQLANADEAFVGLDVGDSTNGLPMAVLPGTTWHDVMTYCANQWMSSYTYEGIRARLAAEDRLVSGVGFNEGHGAGAVEEPIGERTAMAENAADEPNLVNVVATVNLTRKEGRIEYVNPLPRGHESKADVDSPVSLRIIGADGGVLREYPVGVTPFARESTEADNLGLVNVVLAADDHARAIEMTVDGRGVDSFQAGTTVPYIRALTRMDASEDGLSMAWETDAEADDGHTYAIQVSTDNGATWQTLAVGLATPEILIDRDQFRGAENVLVRVIATNGFRRFVMASEQLAF